jgi:hypothetical protein
VLFGEGIGKLEEETYLSSLSVVGERHVIHGGRFSYRSQAGNYLELAHFFN